MTTADVMNAAWHMLHVRHHSEDEDTRWWIFAHEMWNASVLGASVDHEYDPSHDRRRRGDTVTIDLKRGGRSVNLSEPE